MGWVFLLLAGGLEVAFTTSLRMLIKTPNSILLNVIFVILVIASFACLQHAVRSVPLGTGYAVWTGIGAVGTVIVGGLFFGESLPPIRMVFIGLVVAGVVGLKLIEA
ncbi:MAG: multidrug efflux SMR transporter [Hyphomonadaceae bacterium]|jgi:quaternary ammonium compound-resistance protein SugE|nr:multidrug efflux SMR transporter [Hyphomonadaceae bacterium]MBP9235939.1 multidrug efflux SMR transporter [Hyphomonadaceae bacterium]